MDKDVEYTATTADVAKRFGVHQRTVLRWCKDHDIPHRWLPGGPKFNMAEVDEWAKPGVPNGEAA